MLDDSIKKPEAGSSIAAERRSSQSNRSTGRRIERRVSAASEGIGGALRSVYDEAMEEGVPQEMLDLLGKLD